VLSSKDTGWRRTYCFVSLEQHHATALVACCKVVARLVELDSGDDVSYTQLAGAHFTAGAGGAVYNAGHGPSVMSSTSPLSPKHLMELACTNSDKTFPFTAKDRS